MATKTVNTRIKQKIDTEEKWLASELVLLPGEIGFASDTNKMKVGNGVDLWKDLPGISSSAIKIRRW